MKATCSSEPVISVQLYGPDGSGRSRSFPQSKEENGPDGTRKHHPPLDSRLRRRIASAATPSLGAAESIGPISIEIREQQCLGGRDQPIHSVSRGLLPNVVHGPQYAPHTIRSAKSAGSEGAASGPGSRINGT